MAIFRGTALYMRATDQDQAWGTNVRALLGTAGADTNFTVTFTSTTAITQTVNPFTNISNQSADNRTNLGWALNEAEASTDSMGSTSSRKRIIHAGTWSFGFAWTSNAPALLASYDVTIEYTVYRVATGGGTRTLLFTVSAAPVTVSLVAGSGDGAVTSNQSEFLIQPGETIHVAVRINSKATSGVLGGTTNTVITCTGATSGSFSVTLPTPGLRNLTFDSNSSTGSGVGTRSLLVLSTKTGTGSGVGNRNASTIFKDIISSTGAGVGTLSKLSSFYRIYNAAGDGSGTRTLMVQKDNILSFGVGTGSVSRVLDLFREFNSTGTGVGTTSKDIFKDVITTIGDGVGDISKSVIFVRQFTSTGDGVGDVIKSVIFVRDFTSTGKATIRPRIALDWDDLPDPGSGGGTIFYLFPRHRVVNK